MDQIEQMSPKRLRDEVLALFSEEHSTGAIIIRALLDNVAKDSNPLNLSSQRDDISAVASCLYKNERDALVQALLYHPVSQEQNILFKKTIEYFEGYSHLYPWANQQYARMKERRDNGLIQVIKEQRSVEEVLLDMVCEGQICHLDGADIEFIDRKQLWLMMNEILFAEEYFISFDNDHPLMLDCGVNIGLAIYYTKRRYPNARIIGFEPWEKAWSCARRNVERNHWPDVVLHHKALGGHEDTLQLTIIDENSLGSTVTNRMDEIIARKHLEAQQEQVDVITLSPYLNEPVDFLKMDIEGMENEVLQECSSKLKNVKWMFLEHHFAEQLKNNSLSDIILLLQSLEFEFEISKSQAYDLRKRPFAHLGKVTSTEIWARKIVK